MLENVIYFYDLQFVMTPVKIAGPNLLVLELARRTCTVVLVKVAEILSNLPAYVGSSTSGVGYSLNLQLISSGLNANPS